MSSPTWEKMPSLDGRTNPCLCCPPIPRALPMDAIIAVGFGDAHVACDGREVYREPYANRDDCEACGGTGHIGVPSERGLIGKAFFDAWNALPACEACKGEGSTKRFPQLPDPEFWDVAEAEKLAVADPDHDWRIVLFGPLHGEVYQRHGAGQWNLVEKNEGFA